MTTDRDTADPLLPEEAASDPGAAKDSKEAQWLAENQDALDSSNRFVDEHGLPLTKFQR